LPHTAGMIRILVTLATTVLIPFAVCYYFAPVSTMNFLHWVENFIMTGRGQGDNIVHSIQY
jgi:uncharacterized membrane protein